MQPLLSRLLAKLSHAANAFRACSQLPLETHSVEQIQQGMLALPKGMMENERDFRCERQSGCGAELADNWRLKRMSLPTLTAIA